MGVLVTHISEYRISELTLQFMLSVKQKSKRDLETVVCQLWHIWNSKCSRPYICAVHRPQFCAVSDAVWGSARFCSWTHTVSVVHRLRTAGNRAFDAAAPRLWNSLPADVATSQQL